MDRMNPAFLDKLYYGTPFGKERHSDIFAKSKANGKAPLRRMQAFWRKYLKLLKKLSKKDDATILFC